MKSVFHLAEVFLYFASESQPASHGQPFAKWLNPWDGSKYHRDWSEIEDYFGEIRTWLDSWQHGCESWFALWLPLRQRECSPPIVPEFPAVEDFFRPTLPNAVARTFPLLRKLEEVCVWRGGTNPTLDYSISLSDNRERRLFPDISAGVPHAISGRVSARGHTVVFAGQEILLEDASLARLQDRVVAANTRRSTKPLGQRSFLTRHCRMRQPCSLQPRQPKARGYSASFLLFFSHWERLMASTAALVATTMTCFCTATISWTLAGGN